VKNKTNVALAVAAALTLLAGTSARGADTDAGTPYERALQGVLDDVANPEKSFEFVTAAIAAGDLRGAAASLERILLIDPRLANVRLELGELYLRMGNAELAQYHIREALRATNMPQTVRLRATRMLAQASGVGQRNTFRVETRLGYRHDSNANAGPDADAIYGVDPFTLQTVLVPLTSGRAASDSALEGSVQATHSFAFGGTRGSSWDTDLTGYYVKYSAFSELDQYSLGIETGPALVVAGTSEAPISIRPLGLAGKAYLDGASYFDYAGAGVGVSAFWNPATVTQLRVTREHRTFEDTPQRFLSDRSGNYLSADLRQIWQVGHLQISAGLTARQADADQSYQSYDEIGGLVGARYFGVLGASQRPWNVYANVTYGKSDYDAADPFVNPGISRSDKHTDVASGFELGVTHAISASLDLGYTDLNSNLPNYKYDNFSIGLHALVRF
jgi:tetratricopeptide (TPR) repeat protein